MEPIANVHAVSLTEYYAFPGKFRMMIQMSRICFYLQLHQPWRLEEDSLFAVGTGADWFEKADPAGLPWTNRGIVEKVAAKSYRPMLGLLLQLVKEHSDFRFALSVTGTLLEQLDKWAPDVVEILLELAGYSDQVEFLAETYYHSLASLYDEVEFASQVEKHRRTMIDRFGVLPTTFRNTELIYWDGLAPMVKRLGFKGLLTDGVPRYLQGFSQTRLAQSAQGELPILLKHSPLSDDVAFRFSNPQWSGYPLRAETYAHWLTAPWRKNDLINLFMDFETFGEHQWESTGIFAFFEQLVAIMCQGDYGDFVLPKAVIETGEPEFSYYVAEPQSWADIDRDLTAWRGNALQWDTLAQLYRQSIDKSGRDDPVWGRLQTSDHFYYMCTKWAADGDVHAYFSPYGDPYEAYRRYSLALAHLDTISQ